VILRYNEPEKLKYPNGIIVVGGDVQATKYESAKEGLDLIYRKVNFLALKLKRNISLK
jgi:hypothetical protein